MIDKKFEVFQVVAYYKNLTKAASVCHMTQATISRQMQQLEEEIGVPLFTRSTKGITLTPAGEYLHNRASSYIEEYNDIVEGCRSVGNVPFSNLRLSGGPFESLLIVEPINELKRQYKNVKFDYYSFTYRILGSRFENKSIDFCFSVKRLVDIVPDLEYEIIYDKPWLVAAKEDHPFWKLSPEDQGMLKGQRVITTYNNLFEPVHAYCSSAGLNDIEFVETNFLDCMFAGLRTNNCISIFPAFVKKALPEGIIMKDVLTTPMTEPFVACYRPETMNPGSKVFLDICKNIKYDD
jgi:DNA-binding transcriptional LysR family regulator